MTKLTLKDQLERKSVKSDSYLVENDVRRFKFVKKHSFWLPMKRNLSGIKLR